MTEMACVNKTDPRVTNEKIVGLQHIRALAAIAVVVYHCNAMMAFDRYYGASPFPAEGLGTFGVNVFFVISGFIISVVTLDKNRQAKQSSLEFLSKRFIRIVPFMWLCILVYNVFTLFGTGVVEWMALVRSLVLWPAGELKPNVLWTLRHEILFYIIFSFLIVRPSHMAWAPLIVWALMPLAIAVAADLGYVETIGYEVSNDWLNFLFFGRGANLQFVIGLGIGLLWLNAPGVFVRKAWNGSLSILLIFCGVSALAVYASSLEISNLGAVSLYTFLSSIVVFLGVSASIGSARWERLLSLLGDSSYSIYLVHNMFLLIGLELHNRSNFSFQPEMDLAIYCAGAIAAGTIVHLFIERRLVKRLATYWIPRDVVKQF